MKLLFAAALFLCAVAFVLGRPKYFAIPVDDIQFLSLQPQHVRVARQAVYRPQLRQESQYIPAIADVDPTASESRIARQAGGHGDPHDYVDYGAHTGHHGAFGWYADFPVHAHDH